MTENSETFNQVSQWVGHLGEDDPAIRQQAREQLIQLGSQDVTRALVMALIDPRPQVRWEAAKSLQAIADPVAAPALMHALDDEDEDVRWVAAEGLIALRKVGLQTVLHGLLKRARSTAFCRSAHHVLHEMNAFADIVAPVLAALDESEPAVAAPLAAYQALAALSKTGDP